MAGPGTQPGPNGGAGAQSGAAVGSKMRPGLKGEHAAGAPSTKAINAPPGKGPSPADLTASPGAVRSGPARYPG